MSAAPAAAPAARRKAELPLRVAELEDRLGDPTDPGNPLGFAALMRADRAAVPFTEGEAVLDELGLAREFVPRELGGRLTRMDHLVRMLRPVFRRDVGLGMGYGMLSYMAANDVWATGDERQRRWLAALLLGGARATIAQHETAHSNDYVRSQMTARPVPGGFLLNGAKPVISNLDRAEALVLFCRTDPAPGSGSQSVLLLDPGELPREHATILPRHLAVGLRGLRFAGLEFRDCPIPREALLGEQGGGIATAERSFQISRTVVSALAVAAVDTNLRTALSFDREHRARGWRTAGNDSATTEAAFTGAFVNLLLYDSLAVVALRALHLRPAETSVYSAALKYLLPQLPVAAMYDLSIVLGAGFHTTEGTRGIFQKHIRDVPVLSLGHAGTVACQSTLIPQLPRLAARSWFREEAAPAALFAPHGDLPTLDTAAIGLASGRDSLTAALVTAAERIPGRSPAERALRELAELLTGELRELRDRVLAMTAGGRAVPVGAACFALVDRYALLLAAAAVLGVWLRGQGGGDPFLADASWAAAALQQVARRLGAAPVELPPECALRIGHEIQLRHTTRRTFDLFNTPVPG
ncbi:acyl-CoA dehydrogenase [Kitasatospora sp. NBC_01287]|uniref:acyl-CoA dehydrogenase n=1 Tax=Kitasatospora sp. NBC_01287 TaxID=2903573 RepID=UPI002257B813|nr:acyl-CoA dehydrogenase [Kitasatospora sp. NBC_01287]MCX4750330.1 acyl-CoA dehydrogenase [Kitasatospora sp. NBC_01287]